MDFFHYTSSSFSSSFVQLPSSFSSVLYNNNLSRYLFDVMYNEWNVLSPSSSSVSFSNIFITPEDMRIRMNLNNNNASITNTITNNITSSPVPQMSFEFQTLPLTYFTAAFELSIPYEFENDHHQQEQHGLTVQEIEEYSDKLLIDKNIECYICLDTLLKGSCMRQFKTCKHMYCIDCIDQWLKYHKTCPACKKQVNTL